MARAIFVKKARKNNPVCKKGESYYWWKFRFGSKHYSLTKPRQSQLTQSDFLSQIYGLQETIEDMNIESNFESDVEEIKSELENLQSGCEEKRDNMPEQLQDAPTGELLQGRYDSIEEMISELDAIDVECDEDSIKEEVTSEFKEDFEKEPKDFSKEEKEKLESAIEEKIEGRKEEILEEIQNIGYNGE
ncbi:hypothetical protein LCGC14_0462600 [marine sediment metagenome]|uniref:Uncharacterized protein n=1 Tax=marine sediment metagenome TaxID=412755 RepID=A0A0F9V1M8_9ZZZZ